MLMRLILTSALALVLMAAPAGTSFASDFYKGFAEDLHSKQEVEEDRKESYKRIFIEMEAKELGIETEGKDPEKLAEEVAETKIKRSAKELNIDTEGKDIKELAKEVHHAEVKKKADELGINQKGKTHSCWLKMYMKRC